MKNKIVVFLKEWKEYIIVIVPTVFVLIGISIEGFRNCLNYELHFKVWHLIIIILALIILAFYVIKFFLHPPSKIKYHEQILKNGIKVILRTNTTPVMIVSKFNNESNEVLCTWSDQDGIKERWVSQDALKEYVHTPYTPPPSPRKNNYSY